MIGATALLFEYNADGSASPLFFRKSRACAVIVFVFVPMWPAGATTKPTYEAQARRRGRATNSAGLM